ncbi:MAG TPA: hypothetical protein VFZ59_11085 [Verrucomicrobiae bacterium]|nr:hypothetical protein [Verrucomicrobiae bacterium]
MNSPGQPSRKRRFRLTLIAFITGVAIVAVLLFANRPSALPDQVVWLTPSEFAQVKRVGPSTKLKHTLMNWTAPLWKSYWRDRPQIAITFTAFTLPVTTPWPTNCPEPLVITTNGTRVWIFAPDQFKKIEAEFVSLSETTITAQSRITTVAGVSGQVSSGNSFGSGSNATFVGSTAFLAPAVVGGKIVLPIDFTCTQLETNPISGAVSVKTNQDYACRAIFPNNGGLIIENPKPESSASHRHWFYLSAKAVDANGRLIGR